MLIYYSILSKHVLMQVYVTVLVIFLNLYCYFLTHIVELLGMIIMSLSTYKTIRCSCI